MAGDNKPILPNAFVNINNQNLGFIPDAPSGVMAFTGYAVDGSAAKDAIVSIGNNNDVRSLVGFGELADDIITFFNNGGRKALAVPLSITTISVLSAVTKTPVAGGSGTGTITVLADAGKEVTNEFKPLIEITKTGGVGVGKFKFLTNQADTDTVALPNTALYSAPQLIPAGGTFIIPGTNIELTFVDGGGPILFELGDKHNFTASLPLPSTGDIESAVDALIASTRDFTAIYVSSAADTALGSSMATKTQNAEGTPAFRYFFTAVRLALSTSAANAVSAAQTYRATVGDDRLQIVTAETEATRPNHGDQADRNSIGVIAGRRSALQLQNDLGRVNFGPLADVLALRSGWTDTTIEDLVDEQTVTIREFKGLSGLRPTSGPMSNPNSDFKKDAFRQVGDKASGIARLTGLNFVKVDVNPADVEGSTRALRDAIAVNVDTKMFANKEMAAPSQVVIPGGQDILNTETIIVQIAIVPFGHSSFIQIELGLVNPLTAAA